jgi:hypothetical protein
MRYSAFTKLTFALKGEGVAGQLLQPLLQWETGGLGCMSPFQ